MKRIAVTWQETATYEVVIDVPDDYPANAEAYEEAEANPAIEDPHWSGDGESHWFALVDEQQPDWPTKNLQSVSERELMNIERVKDGAK